MHKYYSQDSSLFAIAFERPKHPGQWAVEYNFANKTDKAALKFPFKSERSARDWARKYVNA